MKEDKFKFWTRRILAFIVIAPAMFVLTVLALQGVGSALTALIAASMLVLGLYFGSRIGSEKPES